MTLRHMRIFDAVYRCGSITGAAKKLYLAQPSVSLAVKELENHYGVKLFDRIGRRISPTDAGRQLHGYTTSILSLCDEMDNALSSWDGGGQLKIGSSVTIGNFFLPDAIAHFQHQHPAAHLVVSVGNTDDIRRQVLQNELDVALVEGPAHSDALVSHPFMEDKMMLIFGRSHPFYGRQKVQLEDLAGSPFLLREKGSAGREIFDSIMTLHGLDPTPTWESVSTKAIARAVAKGLGISILPYLLIKPALEAGEIFTAAIDGIPLQRSYFLIYHKNKYLSPTCRAFINQVAPGALSAL